MSAEKRLADAVAKGKVKCQNAAEIARCEAEAEAAQAARRAEEDRLVRFRGYTRWLEVEMPILVEDAVARGEQYLDLAKVKCRDVPYTHADELAQVCTDVGLKVTHESEFVDHWFDEGVQMGNYTRHEWRLVW